VHRVSCALTPLERYWMGMGGVEAMSGSVRARCSVLDCLESDLGVGSRSGLLKPSLLVYY
jgi:hypothetical protein